MKDFSIIFERLHILHSPHCVNHFYIHVYTTSTCGAKRKYSGVFIFHLNSSQIINKLGVYRFFVEILNLSAIAKYERFSISEVSTNMLCNT